MHLIRHGWFEYLFWAGGFAASPFRFAIPHRHDVSRPLPCRERAEAAAAVAGEDKEERRRRRHSERGSENKHKRRRRPRTSGDNEVRQKSDAMVEVVESLHHTPAHIEGQNVVHGGC